jgi:hypothetical protein
MADRSEVLAYAERHGAKQAAERFGLPAGTIRSWRHRAKRRAASQQPAQPTPAEAWLEHARQVVEWASKGACLGCGGAGSVKVPPVRHGGLLVRSGRRIPCPDCGGVPRRIQVNELPRAEWVEGLRVAGDMGLGWNEEEWAMIRAGNPHPDGYRFTGRDSPGGGQ